MTFNFNLVCMNGQFRIETASKYGELLIDEHTWALRINIAVASEALLLVNVKFICEKEAMINCRILYLRTSLISKKDIIGVPPYNKKHRGLLRSPLYAEGSVRKLVVTTMEDPILEKTN